MFAAARRLTALAMGRRSFAPAPVPAFSSSVVVRGYATMTMEHAPMRFSLLKPQSSSLLLTSTQPLYNQLLPQIPSFPTPFLWMQKAGDSLFDTAILQMSSTMKKRRTKMNKHKLRKRRKLLRRKSTG